jgi:hypothetical protein
MSDEKEPQGWFVDKQVYLELKSQHAKDVHSWQQTCIDLGKEQAKLLRAIQTLERIAKKSIDPLDIGLANETLEWIRR